MKMNILIDTDIAIFAMSDRKQLNDSFISLLENLNNRVFVSVASIWEVAIKSIKHPDIIPMNEKQFVKLCEELEFDLLPIKASHIFNLRNLKLKDDKIIHKDPFDKLLISQSICEKLTLYTKDTMLVNYDVTNVKIV